MRFAINIPNFWWCEGLNGWRGPLHEMEERLRAGPPPPPVAA